VISSGLEDGWASKESVAVMDGDGSHMLQGWKPCLMWTDGDGYNLSSNGWGRVNFALPCRSLIQNYCLLCTSSNYLLYTVAKNRTSIYSSVVSCTNSLNYTLRGRSRGGVAGCPLTHEFVYGNLAGLSLLKAKIWQAELSKRTKI